MKARTSAHGLRVGCELQAVCCAFLEGVAGKGKWRVAAFIPEGEKVVTMGATGLAGLTGDASEDGAVPVGEVEDVAVVGTTRLGVAAASGCVGGVAVANTVAGAEAVYATAGDCVD